MCWSSGIAARGNVGRGGSQELPQEETALTITRSSRVVPRGPCGQDVRAVEEDLVQLTQVADRRQVGMFRCPVTVGVTAGGVDERVSDGSPPLAR